MSPIDSIEAIAFEYVVKLLECKRVRLEIDALQISDDHKTLAYVFLLEGDIFANEAILREGYANLSIQPPNTKYADVLRAAYKEARQSQRGLHGQ